MAAGAKLADFGGWQMPIEYQGVVAEHAAVRSAVGIFDVSHMGKVRIHGDGAVDALNAVLANDLDRIGDGRAQYTLLCNESGGVVDDLIVYRWSQGEVFMVPNAANAATVVAALRAALPDGVLVDDHHDDHGIIAVQGPRSAQAVAALGLPADHEYMTMASASYAGAAAIVCRTGYTGEHGYELVLPTASLGIAWDALIELQPTLGLVPAGLGARDTLRTEMGYPLHGQDISPSISPVQAGLGWAVGWDKPAFAGRDALAGERAAGPSRRLRGLLARERSIPRPHMRVHRAAAAGSLDAGADQGPALGEVIGEVTSGTFSPTLRQGIALALLDPGIALGDEVYVDVRGRAAAFEVVAPPFVQTSTRS